MQHSSNLIRDFSDRNITLFEAGFFFPIASEQQNGAADQHSDVDHALELFAIQAMKHLRTEPIADHASDHADACPDQHPWRNDAVDRAYGGRIQIGEAEIELNRREIGDVIARCAAEIEHSGRSAGGKQAVERSADRAGQDAVSSRRLHADIFSDKEKIQAQQNQHRSEQDCEDSSRHRLREANRNRNRNQRGANHGDCRSVSHVFSIFYGVVGGGHRGKQRGDRRRGRMRRQKVRHKHHGKDPESEAADSLDEARPHTDQNQKHRVQSIHRSYPLPDHYST